MIKTTLLESLAHVVFNKRLFALLNKHKGSGLWINFNDVTKDSVQKTMPKNPSSNQGDPNGIYAYPVDWVLDNWAKITHGPLMKFARILKSSTEQVLHVDQISSADWVQVNKKLLTALQIDQSQYDDDDLEEYLSVPRILSWKYNMKDVPEMMRSAYVQAGYQMLVDSSGVIEPQEPSQCVFLTRKAYSIIEMIHNDSGSDYDDDIQLRGLQKAAIVALHSLVPGSSPKVVERERRRFQISVRVASGNYAIKLEADMNHPTQIYVRYSDEVGERELGIWDTNEQELYQFIKTKAPTSKVNVGAPSKQNDPVEDDVPF